MASTAQPGVVNPQSTMAGTAQPGIVDPSTMPQYQALMDRLQHQGYSEEDVKEIMRLGILQQQQGQLKEDLTQAQGLRDADGPEGRYAGRAYVSANPMEHIGAGLNRVRGQMEAKDIRNRQAAMQEKILKGRMTALTAGGGGRAQGPRRAASNSAAQMFPMTGFKGLR